MKIYKDVVVSRTDGDELIRGDIIETYKNGKIIRKVIKYNKKRKK